MKNLRLACALAVALFGATGIAHAAGKPAWVPPADPPQTLLDYACSLLPAAVAGYVPFCN